MLQQTRRKMDELEGLVDEATLNLRRTNAMLEAGNRPTHTEGGMLALQQEVTRILADSTATAGEVTAKILETVCERMKWEVGNCGQPICSPKFLRCTASAFPGTEFADLKRQVSRCVSGGTDLPAGLKSGQPRGFLMSPPMALFLRSRPRPKRGCIVALLSRCA